MPPPPPLVAQKNPKVKSMALPIQTQKEVKYFIIFPAKKCQKLVKIVQKNTLSTFLHIQDIWEEIQSVSWII